MKGLKIENLNAMLALSADAVHHGSGRRESGDAGDAVLHSGAPDGLLIEARGSAQWRINDQVQLRAFDQIDDIGPSFVHLINLLRREARGAERLRCSPRCDQLETQLSEVAGNRNGMRLVLIVH